MTPITLYDGNVKFERVTKTVARKVWESGKPVRFCPVKLHPFGSFRPSMMVQRNFVDEESRRSYELDVDTFDSLVQNFEWYNCTYETGYYPSYWIEA